MRINAQNNQFIFNLPEDILSKERENEFMLLMKKNYIPYDSIVSYVNSTIKELIFPSTSFESVEQSLKRGKKINYKPAQNIHDTFTSEIDITFKAVDSYLNYFILLTIMTDYYLNKKQYIDFLSFSILDKDGSEIYKIVLNNVILKTISEIRLGYQQQDIDEKTFTITFKYNYIDIIWGIPNTINKNIFDIPIKVNKGALDAN